MHIHHTHNAYSFPVCRAGRGTHYSFPVCRAGRGTRYTCPVCLAGRGHTHNSCIHPQLMHTHPNSGIHTHNSCMHIHNSCMHIHNSCIHTHNTFIPCLPCRSCDTPQLIFIRAGRGTLFIPVGRGTHHSSYSFPYAVQAVGHAIHSRMPCRPWDTLFIPVCRAGCGTHHSSYSFPYAVGHTIHSLSAVQARDTRT